MSLTRTFQGDFSAASNLTLTRAEIISGLAKIIPVPTNASISQAFTSDAGFTYDPVKAEFTGSVLRPLATRPDPTHSLIGASFSTNLNGEWGVGTLSVTALDQAAVSGGKLNLSDTGAGTCAKLNPDNFSTVIQTGAIRFKFTPLYSTRPTDTVQVLFETGKSGTNANKIILYHGFSPNHLVLNTYDSAGSLIGGIDGGTFNCVAGTEYEIEVNFDFTTGATRLFVDGVQVGSTLTATGTRTYDAAMEWGIGNNPISLAWKTQIQVRDLIVFDAVQHTSNYTPGQYTVDNNYWATTVVLPTFSPAGLSNLLLTGFTTTEAGAPRYLVNGKYWNGSAWVTSNGSYSQASTKTQVNANLGSLAVTGITFDVSVLFDTSASQGNVDLATFNYTIDTYISDAIVQNSTALEASGASAFSATTSAPASTTIGFIMNINGQDKYWSGAAWVNSNGTYAQSNTAAEVNSHIAALSMVAHATRVIVKIVMASTAETSTPSVSAMSITYVFSPILPSLSTCLVYGFLKDSQGNAISGQRIVFDLLRDNSSSYREANGAVVSETQLTVTTESDGYFELALVKSSEFEAGGRYRVNFGQNSTRSPIDILVPDAEVSDITSLLTAQ